MPLAPPFEIPGADADASRESVTVTVPADLAAWLRERSGGDERLRDALAASALHAARQYDRGEGWPDTDAPPAPRFGTFEEFQAWLDALPDDGGEVPMGEIVRQIYRERGYPMDQFAFGPADDGPSGGMPRFETCEEFQAWWREGLRDAGLEPGCLDGFLREREEERDRLQAHAQAGPMGPAWARSPSAS